MSRRNPGAPPPTSDALPWTGTPKQIAWAKDIRDRKLPEVLEAYRQTRAEAAAPGWGSTWRRAERRARISDAYGGAVLGRMVAGPVAPYVADAKFWIDGRNATGEQILDEIMWRLDHGELQDAREASRKNPAKVNPPRTAYPVLPYAAAHAWERQAAARGVSAVARSHRGFMRAYQAAGSWARLSPWWKRRREGFLARHVAQAMRGENIWERTRAGVWRPTRRSLAMLMWAWMPPRKPAGCRPGVW